MKRPLTLFAFAWVLGMAIGSRLPSGMLSWKIAILAAALAAIAALVAFPGRRWAGLALVAVAAAAYYQGYDARNVPTISLPETAVQTGKAGAAEWEALLEGTIASRVDVDGDKVAFTLLTRTVSFPPEQDAASVRDKVQVSIRLLKREEQDRALAWGRGDQITLTGALKAPEPSRNFGGFDYDVYLYRKHTFWLLSAKGLDDVRVAALSESDGSRFGTGAAADRAMRLNDDIRLYLGSVFDRLFPPGSPDPGYLKSLVLGLTDDMDPELYQQFSQLGLTHILAISGLHVGVFVAGFIWVLRLFRLTKERILTITLVFVPLYVALAGASPSAVRAGIMAMIGLYAARRGLWKDTLNIIGLAAVLMLLWEPYFLYDVSFQLSFLVTLGLIVGVPRFSALLPIRKPSWNSLLSVTIVAQLISFPVTVYYFNGVSLLSAFANFVLVPFISFIVLPLGTLTLFVGAMSVRAGTLLGWLLGGLDGATFWLIDRAATHDPLRLIWPKPSLLWVILFYALLWAAYAGTMRWREGGKPSAAWAAVAAFMLFLWYGYNPGLLDRTGNVQVIDVGQGDAILIRSPQGRHMLIDGGGTLSFRKPGEEWKERKDPYEVGRKLLVPLLKQRGVHRIDVLVFSHQDQDHIGGLQAVVEQIPVRTIVMNGTWKGSASTRKLFETAMSKGARLATVPQGASWPLDRHTTLTMLSAGADRPLRVAEDQNGESVVLLMQMYNTRFLFTGDMVADNETGLLSGWRNSTASATASLSGSPASAPGTSGGGPAVLLDVMKIAHHGSKTSTTAEWLAFWKPQTAVISAGRNNSYGHPNPGVLERLEQIGSDIRRTDKEGEVVFEVTGKGMSVRTKLPGPGPDS
ncbi:DNA internalization-related competence protein ComEC/Rec2 [Paenibacillus hodogayensis]|uniref:DNA internalization-related competence protein ComEC/Rec2 n=1 Tax=Paenibacillus hodogayensis TaxID=279208 RepID=A0ABV5VV59_9BACL